MISAGLVFLALTASTVFGQQVGTTTAENHPPISWQECTASGCTTKNTSVTLDANWRWIHNVGGYANCYTGKLWDTSYCPTGAQCVSNCALEGADYSGTYGITTSGSALTLKFVTGTNVGSRVYLMENDTKYQIFHVLGKEFSFDVDVSKLPCGLNGALYFVQMDSDGGMAKYSGNKAGAKYGTGYCDAQCPRDIKYIAGEANVDGWNSGGVGLGNYGSCCAEMDIWEANSISNAYTPHPCDTTNDGGLQRCSGQQCGVPDRYGGLCDADGCDFAPYRLGQRDYYGPGKVIDTTKPFKVVTQFITDNGSSTGTLKEIRRLYVQDGKVIPNTVTNFPGVLEGYDSLSDAFCDAQKCAFGDTPNFQQRGGHAAMGRSLAKGHVLVLSIWDDHNVSMLWLDAPFPTNSPTLKPGIVRGSCSIDSGKPEDVERDSPNAQVVFSNIRIGTIGSTYSGTLQPVHSAAPPPFTTPGYSCTGTLGTISRTSTSSSTSTSTSSRPTSSSTTTTSTSSTRPTSSSTTSSSSSSSIRPSSSTTTTSTAPVATQTKWGQCGGEYYFGPTQCAAGTTCVYSNPWYSQCL